jgi:alkanesulfonate monooxygenase SsuD/methylene tetrahydromethanopterin reductase-like flavin-dependent oxidoreductase (luciferase family)
MKFGLMFELSVPRPWTPESESTVVHNALEQVRLAEELGFDQTWIVEHHFLEEYSHSSAPDLFLAACAVQTRNMRLGHGIVTCVPQINNPIRIAERAAFLDILSRGRVDVGTGRSATWTELGGFGADPDSTKRSWDEFVRILPRMWTQERFGYQGEFFSMPERTILPKPVQKPHPPMWLAVTSPGTETDAADRGLGCLSLTFGGMHKQAERIATYRRRIQDCTPVGDFVNEQVNCVNFLFCHQDGEYATRVGERLATAFSSAAAQFMEIKESYPTSNYLTIGLLAGIRRDVEGPGRTKGVPEGLAYGDPDRVTEILKSWESAGTDRLIFLLNALETVPQAEVLASMRLFAEEVMPRFRATGDAGGDLAKPEVAS